MATMNHHSRSERLMLPTTAPSAIAKNPAGRLILLCAALVVLIPPAPARAEVTNPHGVAVIIGNRTYGGPAQGAASGADGGEIPAVEFAHRDADAFRRYVLDVLGYDPENVIDLRDATQAQMWSTFGSRQTAERSDLWSYLDPEGRSDVVVFYSGHGAPGIEDRRGYLLPVDADPNTAELNGYPIDVLYKNLSNLEEAKSAVVYLDACFSGGSGGGGMLIANASPVFVEASLPEAAGSRLTVLTAATGKQLASWDRKSGHGLFTHHLLDALYGKGDADSDGRVTAHEAKRYLDRHMTRAARRTYKRRQNAGFSGNAERVLASAGAGGAFPVRPGPGETASADGAAATGGTSATQARADTEVTDEPGVPATVEDKPLNLTRADRRLVQQGLLAAELDVGVVDGLFGPRTEKAIRSYQKKKGWPATGKLTREQTEALMELGKERQAGTAPRATPGDLRAPPKSDPSSIVLANGLRLSDWALLAEDRLEKREYRTLLVEGMAHIRAHGAHGSVQAVVERAFDGLVKGVRVTDEASARSALGTVKQIQGVVGQHAELAAIEAKAHKKLQQLPQAVAAYQSWLRLAPTGHPERKRMLLAMQMAQRGEVEPPRGKVFRDCGGTWCPEMIVVPAGSFMMGSPPGEWGRSSSEGPVRTVTIGEPFAVGVYEITFDEWDACRRGGGCSNRPPDLGWGRGKRPVINVSWKDAQAYVRWLSRETGEEYRLLSESEWEYMARAGTTGPFHFGATISTEKANYNGTLSYGSEPKGRYRQRTVQVGSLPANGFGVHDAHGNVYEWVEDCWHESYRRAPTDGSAWTQRGDCSKRVLRGGSWDDNPKFLRSASRTKVHSSSRKSTFGFRVAKTLD